MASNVSLSLKEAAFECFEAEFSRNGFSVPEGLIRLLRGFTIGGRETPDETRSRIYKRLWCLLWFGSGKSLGGSVPRGTPTYVFPKTLKNVIREIIPGELVDRPDPTHENVYKVNIGDLAAAKWPAAKAIPKKHKNK